jgi:cold shock CspA family protein
LTGVVSDFDEHKGYGSVRADDGAEYFFHCTQIADGSRSIPTGVRVTFDVAAGHGGRWEARSVTAVT